MIGVINIDIKRTLMLLLLGVCCVIAMAQTTNQRKGDENFDNLSLRNAIEYYEKIRDKDLNTKRKLAECYRYLGNTVVAEEYYMQCVAEDHPEPTDIYYYAAMLRSNGKYEDSEKWMLLYLDTAITDSRATEHVRKRGAFKKLSVDNGQYRIQNLPINSRQQDFGAIYFKDKIVFASTREETKPIVRTWNWNNMPFLDLYVGTPNDSVGLSDIKPFDKGLNNKLHEGPASFSQDGTFIAFTRNNYSGKSSDNVTRLQIFTDVLVDGKWQHEKSFPFNHPDYSVGHPALSPDGKTMYFVSDMPGGIGMTDLYKTVLTDTGWSTPENLGKPINTEGNEMFPFYHPKGYLMFASDGHVGLGGLDNFIVEVRGGSYSKIVNMGYPLNDKKDDFAVILDENLKNGYFSSNRSGGKGDDDLYGFQLLKPFSFGKTIKGVVKDENGQPLTSAVVTLWDAESNIIGTDMTYNDGVFSFVVEEDKEYKLNGSKHGYNFGANTASSLTENQEVNCDITLIRKPEIVLEAPLLLHPNMVQKKVLRLKSLDKANKTPKKKNDPFGDDDDDLFPDEEPEDNINLLLEEEEDLPELSEDPLEDDTDDPILSDDRDDPVLTEDSEDLIVNDDDPVLAEHETIAQDLLTPADTMQTNANEEENMLLDLEAETVANPILANPPENRENPENNEESTFPEATDASEDFDEMEMALIWVVTDHATGSVLKDVKIELINNLTDKPEFYISSSDGSFTKPLVNNVLHDSISYTMHMEKHGYMSISVTYNTRLNKFGKYDITEEIHCAMDHIEVGMDIAKLIEIGPIYFDVDDSDIRADAAHELDKVVHILDENPHMELELRSHTDCRGDADYNMELSEKRAKSSAQYIHDRIKGNPERIYGKGYGEKEMVNPCDCQEGKEDPCSEEQHQANRRTDFIIVKID